VTPPWPSRLRRASDGGFRLVQLLLTRRLHLGRVDAAQANARDENASVTLVHASEKGITVDRANDVDRLTDVRIGLLQNDLGISRLTVDRMREGPVHPVPERKHDGHHDCDHEHPRQQPREVTAERRTTV